MTDEQDLGVVAKAIIDSSLYMVLGTADASGQPWVTPVYYAPVTYRELLWVSRPNATHSRNLRARPEVSIVIFDSSVPIGTGQGIYMYATAKEFADQELADAIEVYSRRSLAHGGPNWTLESIRPPAHLRLYRAVATQQFVLDEHDSRVPVTV
jgi:hypothetical protein